jgi:Lar family restriction alleviation protein
MTPTPPLPCPFCGGTTLEVVIIDRRDREGLPAAMSCPDCGCHGPWDYIPDETRTEKIVQLWNKRGAP